MREEESGRAGAGKVGEREVSATHSLSSLSPLSHSPALPLSSSLYGANIFLFDPSRAKRFYVVIFAFDAPARS